jgi:hypothetical protein
MSFSTIHSSYKQDKHCINEALLLCIKFEVQILPLTKAVSDDVKPL